MSDARAEPAAEPEPTHEQLQFARSVFIVLQPVSYTHLTLPTKA